MNWDLAGATEVSSQSREGNQLLLLLLLLLRALACLPARLQYRALESVIGQRIRPQGTISPPFLCAGEEVVDTRIRRRCRRR